MQNEAKVGEKMMLLFGRGWRVGNFYLYKRTEVLLKFSAILPMMREYAKPLLLPTTR